MHALVKSNTPPEACTEHHSSRQVATKVQSPAAECAHRCYARCAAALRLWGWAARVLCLMQAQTKEQADLVVVFTVDTATPEQTLAALSSLVGSSGQLTSALQGKAGVRLVPDSLREVPPASDA